MVSSNLTAKFELVFGVGLYYRYLSANFVTFLSTVYFRTPSNKCHLHRSFFADLLTDLYLFIFHFQILDQARDVYWIGETTSDVHISKRVSTIDYFGSIHKSGSYLET